MSKVQYYLFGLVVLVLIGCLAYVCWERHQEKKQWIGEMSAMADTVHYYKLHGITHAERQVEQMPADMYNHSNDSMILALRRDIKAKDLVIAAQAKLSVSGSGHFAVGAPISDQTLVGLFDDTAFSQWEHSIGNISDTNSRFRPFHFEDTLIKINGLVLTPDLTEAYLTYRIDDIPIGFVAHWKRDHFWQRKNLYGDFSSTAPNIHFSSIRTVTIAPPPKKFWETKAFAAAIGLFGGFYLGLHSR